MLSNAYFLAKFRFDTAENEPAKNLQNFANFPNFANPNPSPLTPNSSSVSSRGSAIARHARRAGTADGVRAGANAAGAPWLETVGGHGMVR